MNTFKKSVTLAVILLLTGLYSCAPGKYTATGQAAPEEIAGTFTLILHGGRYSEDVENVAVLDKEGDRYFFEILASEYDYTVMKNISAGEALERAEKFVGSHRAFRQSVLRRISDKEGITIGYELRPLYHLTEFGNSDILVTSYRITDNKVIAVIRLKQELEHREPFLFRGR
ncbi:MAG: hypothetical protein C4560_10225 [Nitrospiraceae bacterium]|nr:MAG: hypothetical protein C4560_10225 [Nitrospiraceae bacterium]